MSRRPAKPEIHSISHQPIIAHTPDDHESLAALGRVYLATGRLEESAAQLREATRLWDKEPSYYGYFGDALAGLGRYEEARTAYETGLELALPGEECTDRLLDGLGRLP